MRNYRETPPSHSSSCCLLVGWMSPSNCQYAPENVLPVWSTLQVESRRQHLAWLTRPEPSSHPPASLPNPGSGKSDSCICNTPSPTPLNDFSTNHPSTRSRLWPSQQCSSSGWLSSAPRLTTSPPSSTCGPTSWGSPRTIPCVVAPQERFRRLPVKQVSYLGDTELRPCQAIGLLGTRKDCVPCQGLCTLPGCWRTGWAHKGTVESLLICQSLSPTKVAAVEHTMQVEDSFLQQLVHQCISQDPVQFWPYCTTMALVISAVKLHGLGLLSRLLRLTRNYCFCCIKPGILFLCAIMSYICVYSICHEALFM